MKGFFCLCLLYFVSFTCFATEIRAIRLDESAARTVVRCQLSGAFRYHAFTLANPSRVILDFEGVQKTTQHVIQTKKSIAFKKLRVGHPKPQTLRLVLDMQTPFEIVRARRVTGTKGQHEVLLELKSKKITPVMLDKPPKLLRDVVVVIDPGHGGKDPGAIGAKKSMEKKVVLAIAKRLKQYIDKQPGMRAVLTRTGDYYVGLRERLEIARKQDADIFVSIHADAFIHARSKGASVFALSQRGATSEAARWLAEKENYSELGGVNLSELDDQNDLIRTVLIDLSQTATTTASLQMGSQVLKRLGHVTSLHAKGVEQARFVVLKSPDIPSILVEMGFISNPQEEKNLNDASYQQRAAQAIFEGLKAYFWNHPPHGTRLEAMANANLKIVQAASPVPQLLRLSQQAAA